MLQGLKAADGGAELLAGFAVLDGLGQQAVKRSHGF